MSALPEDFLTCSLCLEQFTQPKSLACLHTFCASCLQDYVTATKSDVSLACPLCQQNVAIPGNSVGNFPTNFAFQNLILHIQQKPEEEVKKDADNSLESSVGNCYACESLAPLVFHCSECKMWLCCICTKAHRRMPVTREHTLMSENDVTTYCRQQAEQKQTETLYIQDELDKTITKFNIEKLRIRNESASVIAEIEAEGRKAHEEINNQVKDLNDRVNDFYEKKEINELLKTAEETKSSIAKTMTLVDDVTASTDGRSALKRLHRMDDFDSDTDHFLAQIKKKKCGNFTLNFSTEGMTKFQIGDLCERFTIDINNIDNTRVSLWVRCTDTVKNVKERLGEKVGDRAIPEKIRLVYNGNRMDDSKTLKDLNIKKDEILGTTYKNMSDFQNGSNYCQYICRYLKPGDKIKCVKSYGGISAAEIGITVSVCGSHVMADWTHARKKYQIPCSYIEIIK